jgi:hypothetical protein
MINLGAGDKPLPEPWRNYDLPDFNVATDQWPFPDSSINRVNADCLLPHIAPPRNGEMDGFHHFMLQLARVLKPGGLFTFTAPDWRDPKNALTDVYHYRLIGPRSFYHFTKEPTNRPLGANGVYFTNLKFKKNRKSYLLSWSLERNGEPYA